VPDRLSAAYMSSSKTRNAIEAMEDTPPEHRNLRIQASLDNDGDIVVEVIDRGHGIPASVADRLFSPFFSTKTTGMGMGLNICRTAIEFHGGKLTHRDNPVGGSIFRFILPAVHEENNPADLPTAASQKE